jgi:hypothetical protein
LIFNNYQTPAANTLNLNQNHNTLSHFSAAPPKSPEVLDDEDVDLRRDVLLGE